MGSSRETRTWDGLHIAEDEPNGATIVVRRHTGSGAARYLILHRNANGPDYEGDWAWTSPAGARFPGEAVHAGALRELAEEAGIVGHDVWAVDLSGWWAVFAVDVEPDVAVTLVDPEHDRYEWLGLGEAMARVRPGWVAAAQCGKVDPVPRAVFGFESMTTDDLADVIGWQQAPHAKRWFQTSPVDPDAAIRHYGPRFDGAVPTRMWIVTVDGRRVGYLQDYRVSDHEDTALRTGDPEAVGFDYLIGEPQLVGRGLATAMIWSFMRDVLCRDYPDAPRFLASPDHRNTRSIRALEKCGLRKGRWIDMPSRDGTTSTEVVCTLDRAHWFGTGVVTAGRAL